MGLKDALRSKYTYFAAFIIVVIVYLQKDLTIEKILFLIHHDPLEISKRLILTAVGILGALAVFFQTLRSKDLKTIEDRRDADKKEVKEDIDALKKTTTDTNEKISELVIAIQRSILSGETLSEKIDTHKDRLETHYKMTEQFFEKLEKGHDEQEKKIKILKRKYDQQQKVQNETSEHIREIKDDIDKIKNHLKIE